MTTYQTTKPDWRDRLFGGTLPRWAALVIAAQLAVMLFLGSNTATDCAHAASCQVTDTEVFGSGATFNSDRGSAAENDVVANGSTVDNVLHVDASADTTFFNGTVDASSAVVLGFPSGPRDVQSFDSPGAAQWDAPVGVNWAFVEMVGGGGGGAGGSVADGPGSAGASGGYCAVLIDVSALPSLTLNIGAGGAGGGAATDGSAGTASTVSDGSTRCTAGGGGEGFAQVSTAHIPGNSGGSASDGDVTVNGTASDFALATDPASRSAPSSFFGGGNLGSAGVGIPGTRGAGGSGAGPAASAGGAGGAGYIVITSFQ